MAKQTKNTLDLSAVTYDVYTSTAGVKTYTILELDEKTNDKGFLQFRLKCIDQNKEVHFEEFNLSVYGLRKLKKFCERTEIFDEKEMQEFNHYKFLEKTFQLEYFSTKNKHYDKTNPNSKEFTLVVGNDTYSKIKSPKETKND